MSRNGNGVYFPPGANFPAVDNTVIEADDYNAVINDITVALTQSLAADGQTTVTSNIPMSNHKLTGLSAGSTAGDSVEYAQFQAGLSGVSSTFPATFPAGTKCLFMQASAPTGWTMDTSFNDRMLYINNSSGADIGGTSNPLLNNTVPSHTHTATSVVTDPGHKHTNPSSWRSLGSQIFSVGSNWLGTSSSLDTGTATTGVTVTTTVAANSGAGNWTPKYATAIVCTKN